MRTLFKPVVSHIFAAYLEKKNLFILHRLIGNSIGDTLCMTSIIRELYNKYMYKIVIITTCPDIFLDNPYVFRIINCENFTKSQKKSIRRFLSLIDSKRCERYGFRRYNLFITNYTIKYKKINAERYMAIHNIKRHLTVLHSWHFGIKLDYNNINNEIYLSSEEIKTFKEKFMLPDHYCIIQSEGKTTYTPNKEWGFEKFQQVVNILNNMLWIQTGSKTSKSLEGTLDLRGKTSLRELFYLISRAKFILSTEGLLNHAASAFNKKSFVVFSGFHPVEIAKYPCTIPITSKENVLCAPCGLLTPCPIVGKPCTENIIPEMVVKAIEKEVAVLA
jgi:ADP-heptose:LPS heptosyltransferase